MGAREETDQVAEESRDEATGGVLVVLAKPGPPVGGGPELWAPEEGSQSEASLPAGAEQLAPGGPHCLQVEEYRVQSREYRGVQGPTSGTLPCFV